MGGGGGLHNDHLEPQTRFQTRKTWRQNLKRKKKDSLLEPERNLVFDGGARAKKESSWDTQS